MTTQRQADTLSANAPGVEEFLRNEAFCRRFVTAQVHREVLGRMKEGSPLIIIWVLN